MKRAIVTICLGKRHEDLWNRICKDNWQAYADKYNLDIITFTEPLGTTERDQKRSPSWQKCLILSQEKVQQYDQIVWLDSDILINHKLAPNIFETVAESQIGGIEDWSYPTPEGYVKAMTEQIDYARSNNLPTLGELSVKQYYENYGLTPFDKVVQGGVLVFSPKLHRALLEKIYNKYEDKGASYWHYEMRPLSYEILKTGQNKWLDPKFNYVWAIDKILNYPELVSIDRRNGFWFKLFRRINFELGTNFFTKKYSDTLYKHFNEVYFFHFAGCLGDMLLINNKIKTK